MASSNAQAQIEMHRALAPRYAFRYSFPFSRLFQQDWHAEMMGHVPEGSKTILDLGCGTGFFLAELLEKHPSAVGLDISFEMLQVSDQYIPGAKLITGDAERLPFKPGVFDVVFCKGSLHHTRDHVAFLKHCREALRPGGVLIMSEPCNDNPFIRAARALMYKKSQHFDVGDQGFTRKGVLELLEQADFDTPTVKKYGVLAYVFAGFPDHLSILRYIPGNYWITRAFLAIDRALCATPLLSLLGFHIVTVSHPKGIGRKDS
ncbi:MAG: class I SAM-dependent methyltransferase [Planctomycetes bacterium]|nr:class I SAM-dependent methyltransferase [Planctomycetota bacterium]